MANAPVQVRLTIVGGTTYTAPANIYDFATVHGTHAKMLIIKNTDTDSPLKFKLNGSSEYSTLDGAETLIFQYKDLAVTKIAFHNDGSSGSGNATVELIAGL